MPLRMTGPSTYPKQYMVSYVTHVARRACSSLESLWLYWCQLSFDKDEVYRVVADKLWRHVHRWLTIRWHATSVLAVAVM
jgi:hypothetical protein